MSIERQLTEAFKSNNSSLECPPSIDQKVMAQYRAATMAEKGSFVMKKKSPVWKTAIVAVLVVVLSGFAYSGTKLLYSNSEGKVQYSIHSSEAFQYTPEELGQLRGTIKEVQDQLEPGQTAAVYLPQLFKQFPNVPPLFGVTKPAFISDLQQWREILDQEGVTEVLPEALLGGQYQFAEGAVNDAHVGTDVFDIANQLKAEYESRVDDEPVWRLTQSDDSDFASRYLSIYRNIYGEAIQLNWEVYNETMKVDGFTSASSQYESFELNGETVHYIYNTQYLFGDSSELQSVIWQEEKDDATIFYSVETHSPNITQEQLLAVAEQLLQP